MMARIRTVKPEFFTSLDIAGLSIAARLLFIGLFTHADDDGRGLYEPRLIKAAVFPLDDDLTAQAVDNLLGELVDRGLLLKYAPGDGTLLFQIATFAKHQRIDKKKPSRYPSPPDHRPVADQSTTGPVSLPPGKEQGKEQGKDDDSLPVAQESADESPSSSSPSLRWATDVTVAAARLLAERDQSIANPDAWVATVAPRLRTERRERIIEAWNRELSVSAAAVWVTTDPVIPVASGESTPAQLAGASRYGLSVAQDALIAGTFDVDAFRAEIAAPSMNALPDWQEAAVAGYASAQSPRLRVVE